MLNKVELIGRVGEDIKLETTTTGKNYVIFSLATNKQYTDSNGNKVETTAWHRIKVWQKQAEIVAQYSGKGRLLFIEGELEYSEYEKNGVKHYSTAIRANNIKFLDRAPQNSTVQPANVSQAQTNDGSIMDTNAQPEVNNDFTGDDIPF